MTAPATPRPLTLGEIATVEKLVGVPASEWGDAPSQGKLLAALAFVYTRREDPEYTWNQALDLTQEDALAVLTRWGHDLGDTEAAEDGEAPDPTEPASTPRRATRSRSGSKTSARS
jgi:hypothetical protein